MGPGVEGVQGDEVLDAAGVRLLQYPLIPRAFELEGAGALALAEHAEGRRMFSGMDFSSMGTPFLRTSSRASSMTVSVFRPRKVHLDQPALLEEIHGELRGDEARLRIAVQGHVVRQRLAADHDARRMRRCMAVQAFQLSG